MLSLSRLAPQRIYAPNSFKLNAPTGITARARILHRFSYFIRQAYHTDATSKDLEEIGVEDFYDLQISRAIGYDPEYESIPDLDTQLQIGESHDFDASDARRRASRRHQTEKEVESFRTLEEMMQNKGTKSSQESFRLSTTRHHRVLSQAVRKQEIDDTTNSNLKKRGSWSYDWRVPLLELSQNYEPDGLPLEHINFMQHVDTYRQFSTAEISVPPQWSQQSFAGYVNDLAQSRVSRLVARDLYEPQDTHVHAVKDVLFSLFRNDDLQQYMTIEALENALRFFYRYDLVNDAKKLFRIMFERQIPLRGKTFNIALRAIAAHRDLHNFTYLLRSMINLGLKPSEESWLSLVVVLESTFAKYTAIQNMKTLGVLDRTDVLQAVAADVLTSEFKGDIADRPGVTDVLNKLDLQLGPQWFSMAAGNSLCKHLCQIGQPEVALIFVDAVVQRGSLPNRGTLDVLLTHCLWNLDSSGALNLLKLFWRKYSVVPHELGYHVLFMIAWETHQYNVCRVVWWKACIDCAVTFRMQELVMRSLLRNTPLNGAGLPKTWMKEVGKVSVGIEVTKDSLNGEETASSLRNAKEKIAAWCHTGEERTVQIKLAKQTMRADLRAYKKYKFGASKFHDVFSEALMKDQSWRDRGLISISVMDKIQDAVHIPIRSKVRTYGHGKGD